MVSEIVEAEAICPRKKIAGRALRRVLSGL